MGNSSKSKSNQVSSCQRQEARRRKIKQKSSKGFFGGHGSILYLDYGDGYMML